MVVYRENVHWSLKTKSGLIYNSVKKNTTQPDTLHHKSCGFFILSRKTSLKTWHKRRVHDVRRLPTNSCCVIPLIKSETSERVSAGGNFPRSCFTGRKLSRGPPSLPSRTIKNQTGHDFSGFQGNSSAVGNFMAKFVMGEDKCVYSDFLCCCCHSMENEEDQILI